MKINKMFINVSLIIILLLFNKNFVVEATMYPGQTRDSTIDTSYIDRNINYKILSISDKSVKLMVDISDYGETTLVDFVVWRDGNNLSPTRLENFYSAGQGVYETEISFSEIGFSSEYIHANLYFTSRTGFKNSYISIKLDSISPNLSLTPSTTYWTNQDVKLKYEANDNMNIIETIELINKNTGKTLKRDLYSKPRILAVNRISESDFEEYILEKLNNEYEIHTYDGGRTEELRNLAKNYDIFMLYSGPSGISDSWSLFINSLFEDGVSIITICNDEAHELKILSDKQEQVEDGGNVIINTYTNNSVSDLSPTPIVGRTNRILNSFENHNESDSSYYKMYETENSYTLSNAIHEDGTISSAILMESHPNGNKWIHGQSYSVFPRRALRRAMDEIMYGTNKTRQDYVGEFTIEENGDYIVKTTDFSGNSVEKLITISNIDREPPSIMLTPKITWGSRKNIEVVASDNLSGVSHVISPSGDYIHLNDFTFTATTNGEYTFVAEDRAGNSTIKTIDIIIDNFTPIINISGDAEKWHNSPQRISIDVYGLVLPIIKTEYSLSGGIYKDWSRYSEAFTLNDSGKTRINARVEYLSGEYSYAYKEIWIDMIKPTMDVNVDSVLATYSMPYNVSYITDMLSGAKEIWISENSNFSTKTVISVSGKSEYEGEFQLTELLPLEKNHQPRNVYFRVYDNAGNFNEYTKSVVIKKNYIDAPILTSPTLNQLFVDGELVKVAWSNLGELGNTDKAKIQILNESGNIVKSVDCKRIDGSVMFNIQKGKYTGYIYFEDDYGTISKKVQFNFRYGEYLNEGSVRTIIISPHHKIKHLLVSINSEIPKDCEVEAKIYHSKNSNGSVDHSKYIPLKISDSGSSKLITLDDFSSNIQVELIMKNNTSPINYTVSPILDSITVYAK